MKLWFLSDLHLEYADLSEPLKIPDADVCIVAGDLCCGVANGVQWLADHVAPAMPCIYVAGNHEFYNGGIRENLEDGRAACRRVENVHFLENDIVVINGVRFIGATLWTDYRIAGHQSLAMRHARERMTDHRKIALQKNPWQRFLPESAYRMHVESRLFIESSMKADQAQTVVVTHHLPYPASVHPRFKGDLLNGAFASDLGAVIDQGRPALWVHGHTHDSCDYRVGATRVLCNPRGYDNENAAFNPSMIVGI
ncbi:metallophosphoesterase [Nitratireductor aquimarinus]|uniref:metallophosphoesterase n=1 Tax=Nitratireductor aquimarinus TaxID=889300 RepID=UPI002936C6AF|nr:metallophosphoesterase [Nitratireductor aquimarinus]MDV2968552.1 metallophosphoesterase [Nitratireductor aquimarinus]